MPSTVTSTVRNGSRPGPDIFELFGNLVEMIYTHPALNELFMPAGVQFVAKVRAFRSQPIT